MQFTLYTDKSISECTRALNTRMHTKSRHNLDGYTEKGGAFGLSVTTRVAERFARTTRLNGKMERIGGVTVIKGTVNSGASPREQIIIIGGLVLIALATFASGNALISVIAILVGIALYIPLTGDHHNSTILMNELQRTLGAKSTPPKAGTKKPAVAKTTGGVKPAAKTASRPATPAGSKPRSGGAL